MARKLSPPRKIAVRLRRGDFMSPETRSRVMSRIRGRDANPELVISALLRGQGLDFKAARDLPGRPDFVSGSNGLRVLRRRLLARLAIFAVAPEALEEVGAEDRERLRDARNHRLLRKAGWRVVRFWEHQIEAFPEGCLDRVLAALHPQGRRLDQNEVNLRIHFERVGL